MKFKAEKNILSEAVINASKACASKTAFNALDGVLLTLVGNTLTVTGYDLEIGIRTTIKVEGIEDGEIVIDAKLFSDMVRRMPSENMVEVAVQNDKDVKVQSGKIKLDIQGVSANNFPNIIELNEDVSFRINESLIKNMLSQVNHAISQSDMNLALAGAKFEIIDGTLFVVASDGMRLALRKEKKDYNDISFIVPEKTVIELTRNLSESDESEVNVIIDRNQICFMKKNYVIFSRLLDGKFIDYRRITDFVPKREVILNVRETISSLERSLLLITEKYKSPVICLLSAAGSDVTMNLSCKTNLGSFSEDLVVKHTLLSDDVVEEDFEIAFNPRFMIDALKNSLCDEVKVLINTELSPIKIVPMADDDFIFVVVPVRMKQ